MSKKPDVPLAAACPVDVVRIFGKPFTITADPELDQCVAGEMDLTKQSIRYRIQPGVEYNKDTVLHEITHAVDESLGLGMTEDQVWKLATGFLSIFLDNPVLTKWLTTNER